MQIFEVHFCTVEINNTYLKCHHYNAHSHTLYNITSAIRVNDDLLGLTLNLTHECYL